MPTGGYCQRCKEDGGVKGSCRASHPPKKIKKIGVRELFSLFLSSICFWESWVPYLQLFRICLVNPWYLYPVPFSDDPYEALGLFASSE